ncbi:unnamed protein product, partial [Polarella glacialis]
MAEAGPRLRPWVTVGPEPRAFCTETNRGLGPVTSKLLASNNFQSRSSFSASGYLREYIRNDPSENSRSQASSRPRSAMAFSASRARSSSSSGAGYGGGAAPPAAAPKKRPPVDPQTGRAFRPDPRSRTFHRTASSLSMRYAEPQAKEWYMAPRWAVANATTMKGRHTP